MHDSIMCSNTEFAGKMEEAFNKHFSKNTFTKRSMIYAEFGL